jgi:hypothetical protein
VSGLAVSQIGDYLYNLALVVLVYDRTHSAAWAGVTIVVGSVIAPGLTALLGGSGALAAVGGAVLAYALLVLRGAGRRGRPALASRPAMADAVPAR